MRVASLLLPWTAVKDSRSFLIRSEYCPPELLYSGDIFLYVCGLYRCVVGLRSIFHLSRRFFNFCLVDQVQTELGGPGHRAYLFDYRHTNVA